MRAVNSYIILLGAMLAIARVAVLVLSQRLLATDIKPMPIASEEPSFERGKSLIQGAR